MYWWNKAAELVARGSSAGASVSSRRTASRRRSTARVVQTHLDAQAAIRLVFAIPDHPWVDSADGAAVSSRDDVARRDRRADGARDRRSRDEVERDDVAVEVCPCDVREAESTLILRSALQSSATVALRANGEVCFHGVQLVGDGFLLSIRASECARARLATSRQSFDRYVIGRDLTQTIARRCGHRLLRPVRAGRRRELTPRPYQHVCRSRKAGARLRTTASIVAENWWLFGENAPKLRASTRRASRGSSRRRRPRSIEPSSSCDWRVLPDT